MPNSPRRSQSPNSFGSGSGSNNGDNVEMTEEQAESMASKIPLANFKSNQINKKEMFIDTNMEGSNSPQEPGSPSQAYAMRHVFENRGVDSPSNNITFCICGMPCPPNQASCDQCEGKNSVHMEGEILKKQKRGGSLKKYWFVLLGKELYSYKNQADLKHKEMKSLAGVYLKEELEEEQYNGTTLYPFMLIFPNKRRIYYLGS